MSDMNFDPNGPAPQVFTLEDFVKEKPGRNRGRKTQSSLTSRSASKDRSSTPKASQANARSSSQASEDTNAVESTFRIPFQTTPVDEREVKHDTTTQHVTMLFPSIRSPERTITVADVHSEPQDVASVSGCIRCLKHVDGDVSVLKWIENPPRRWEFVGKIKAENVSHFEHLLMVNYGNSLEWNDPEMMLSEFEMVESDPNVKDEQGFYRTQAAHERVLAVAQDVFHKQRQTKGRMHMGEIPRPAVSENIARHDNPIIVQPEGSRPPDRFANDRNFPNDMTSYGASAPVKMPQTSGLDDLKRTQPPTAFHAIPEFVPRINVYPPGHGPQEAVQPRQTIADFVPRISHGQDVANESYRRQHQERDAPPQPFQRVINAENPRPYQTSSYARRETEQEVKERAATLQRLKRELQAVRDFAEREIRTGEVHQAMAGNELKRDQPTAMDSHVARDTSARPEIRRTVLHDPYQSGKFQPLPSQQSRIQAMQPDEFRAYTSLHPNPRELWPAQSTAATSVGPESGLHPQLNAETEAQLLRRANEARAESQARPTHQRFVSNDELRNITPQNFHGPFFTAENDEFDNNVSLGRGYRTGVRRNKEDEEEYERKLNEDWYSSFNAMRQETEAQPGYHSARAPAGDPRAIRLRNAAQDVYTLLTPLMARFSEYAEVIEDGGDALTQFVEPPERYLDRTAYGSRYASLFEEMHKQPAVPDQPSGGSSPQLPFARRNASAMGALGQAVDDDPLGPLLPGLGMTSRTVSNPVVGGRLPITRDSDDDGLNLGRFG